MHRHNGPWLVHRDRATHQVAVLRAASGTATPRAWTNAHAVAVGRSQYARAYSVPVFKYREGVFEVSTFRYLDQIFGKR
jgi:hypothetical protein